MLNMKKHDKHYNCNNRRNAYIQILPDDPPLEIIGDVCLGQVTAEELERLSGAEVHVVLPVHGFVVHLG